MATQAAIFAETIAGMKKAVKRKAYGGLHTNLTEVIFDNHADHTCVMQILIPIARSNN
jgi:hypothetical protein